jgi:hypothetical protein
MEVPKAIRHSEKPFAAGGQQVLFQLKLAGTNLAGRPRKDAEANCCCK